MPLVRPGQRAGIPGSTTIPQGIDPRTGLPYQRQPVGGGMDVGRAVTDGLAAIFPTVPPTPDLTGAAEEQARRSRENTDRQTRENRPDRRNSLGQSETWSIGPDGRPVLSQTLGGPLGDAQNSLMNQIGGRNPFNFAGLPELTTGEDARKQAFDAAYGQSTSRLDPQWQQRESQLHTQLLNQGLDPESEAYKNATQQMSFDRNDAYAGARNSAIEQSTAAGQAIFNQSVTARQIGSAEKVLAHKMPASDLQDIVNMMRQPDFVPAQLAESPQLVSALLGEGSLELQRFISQNKSNGDIMGNIGNLFLKLLTLGL